MKPKPQSAASMSVSKACKKPKEGRLVSLIFDHRPLVLMVFALATLYLGYHAFQLRPTASFLRMIPTYSPYIQNYITHEEDLKGMGNTVRVAVETTNGTILDENYLETLRKVSSDLFYIPGVMRGGMVSLWSPIVRWSEITDVGFEGGPVIPDSYDGSAKSLEQVRQNILKSKSALNITANNFKSSVIIVPLQDINPETGQPIDYKAFSDRLEEIRNQYQTETFKIHITGFAKLMGDLIEGGARVGLFFIIAFVILLGILQYNSRCWRSVLMRGISSSVAVILQLGVLSLLGYGLNPYSMLVPFLIFALGVSHGIQMFNTMAQEMALGADKLSAARKAYNKLYIPGLAALFTDCIGFATLFVIRIGVIQDIAVGASIGVAVVALSDLVLLPVLMSYTGISYRTVFLLHERQTSRIQPVWKAFSKLIQPKPAMVTIIIGLLLFSISFYVRQDLKIGDLDPGAPELRKDSRYNRDNAFLNANYSTSSDVFVVMLETPKAGNSEYDTVMAVDRLQWKLRQLQGVQNVFSYVDYMKTLNAGYTEGHPKWTVIPSGKKGLDSMVSWVPKEVVKPDGSFSPIIVYLKDHKNETLSQVTALVEDFAARQNTDKRNFLLAAGNAGIEAATNIEVERAQFQMVLLVFSVIFMTCLIAFRSIKAAISVVIPLYITSILCEAMMTVMGIGVKVATLPVIAVGVGIGVDYGVYIYNKFIEYLKECDDPTQAFLNTLNTTGRAVTFTGVTLAIGVGTWIFSPIKFQGDMGMLLVLMFLWNMIGALCLIPAIVCFIGVPKRFEKLTQTRKSNSLFLNSNVRVPACGSSLDSPSGKN